MLIQGNSSQRQSSPIGLSSRRNKLKALDQHQGVGDRHPESVDAFHQSEVQSQPESELERLFCRIQIHLESESTQICSLLLLAPLLLRIYSLEHFSDEQENSEKRSTFYGRLTGLR